MERDEARQLVQVALAAEPDVLEVLAASFRTLNLFMAMYIVVSPWPRACSTARARGGAAAAGRRDAQPNPPPPVASPESHGAGQACLSDSFFRF